MSVNKHLWISKSNNILPYLTNINIMTCLSCSINFAIQINNNCAGHANEIYSKICYLESHLAAGRACSPISCGSLGGISPLNLVLWTGLRQTEDHQMRCCVCSWGLWGQSNISAPGPLQSLMTDREDSILLTLLFSSQYVFTRMF